MIETRFTIMKSSLAVNLKRWTAQEIQLALSDSILIPYMDESEIWIIGFPQKHT